MLLTCQKENSAEMSLLSTGLTFIPTWNNIEKEKLKLELGAFGGKLQWKWHFRNGEKDFDYDNFKTKFTINPLIPMLQLICVLVVCKRSWQNRDSWWEVQQSN